MPAVTGFIQADGILIEVRVGWGTGGVQSLRAALRPVPQPIQSRALLDTGAEISCVDAALVQALGLPGAGFNLATVPAAGGMTMASKHDVSLTVVHPSGDPRQDLTVLNLAVLELSLVGLGYEVLVGRDVLARCRLLYHGPRGRFRLAY
jgi:hypothetical protein